MSTPETPNLHGVFRFVARLHTLSKRGMRAALANEPKCRYGMLQHLYNLIEQHGVPVQRIFAVIAGRFPETAVFVETMSPMVVRRFREKSIEGSHAKFTWGVKGDAALAALLPDFRFVEQHSLIEGMAVFAPVYKALGRIIVLERA